MSAATGRRRFRGCMPERITPLFWNSERRYCTCPQSQQEGENWEPRFHPGVFVGMLNSSSEAVVVTEQGMAIKTRSANIRSELESEVLGEDHGHARDVNSSGGSVHVRVGRV